MHRIESTALASEYKFKDRAKRANTGYNAIYSYKSMK